MAMMKCPECKKKMSTDADACPKCGYKLTEECRQAVLNKKPWYKKTWGRVMGVLCILFVLVAIASDKGASPDRATQQGAATSRVSEEEKQAATAEINNLRQHLRSRVDEVENKKWIHSKKTPDTFMANNIYTYLGEDGDGDVWPRTIFGFERSGWIFMHEIIINVDGAKYTIKVDPLERKQEVLYGGKIQEYIDLRTTPELEIIMWQVANGNNVTVRFKGDQYYHDFKPSQQQKEALKHIWGYYMAKRVLGEAI